MCVCVREREIQISGERDEENEKADLGLNDVRHDQSYLEITRLFNLTSDNSRFMVPALHGKSEPGAHVGSEIGN